MWDHTARKIYHYRDELFIKDEKEKIQLKLAEKICKVKFGGRVDVSADSQNTVYGIETHFDQDRRKENQSNSYLAS